MLSYSVMSNSLQTHEEPPSSVHGILQIRILEWVAISSLLIFLTQGSDLSLLRLLHWQAHSLPWCHLETCIYTFEYERNEVEVWDEAIAWMFLFVHISLSCISRIQGVPLGH